jgi:hypothetical protein
MKTESARRTVRIRMYKLQVNDRVNVIVDVNVLVNVDAVSQTL